MLCLQQNTCKEVGVSILTSPSSSFTWTITPKGTLPGGYNAHLLTEDCDKSCREIGNSMDKENNEQCSLVLPKVDPYKTSLA